MDHVALGVWMAIAGLIGGILGALIGGIGALQLIERLWPAVQQRLQVIVDVAPVTVRAQVAELEPVVIPLEVAPSASLAELAGKILAEDPDMGPRALARILGCAPSTAQTLIGQFRAARETPAVK